jgi:hypothetical protein
LNQVAIDTSVIGPPILQVLNGASHWKGLLAELLEALNAKVPDSVRRSQSWPSIPRQLKTELNRLAPNLRQIGIEVRFEKRTNQGIPIELERIGKSSSLSTPSSSDRSLPHQPDVDSDDSADEIMPNLTEEVERL